MLKVHSVSTVKTEKSRKDGKKSREYVTVNVADSNPFSRFGTKLFPVNIFQSTTRKGENTWGAVNPLALKAFEGKEIPGDIQTIEVEPYSIGEGEQARIATHYSCAVLAGYTAEQIAKNNGMKLKGEAVAQETEIAA
jgi:hypothetical protein